MFRDDELFGFGIRLFWCVAKCPKRNKKSSIDIDGVAIRGLPWRTVRLL